MSETPTETTPQRMSTRNQARVNYNEGPSNQPSSEPVFRSPTASTRGRKKRPIIPDVAELSSSFGALNYATPPKRGRPRGSGLGSVRGRAAVRRAATRDEGDFTDDKELVAAVKSGKKIPEAVDKWVERYNEKYVVALTEIHQFFFSISGCKAVITPNMASSLSMKDIICKMTEDFEEDSSDYPLVHGGNVKRIRTNIHNFIHALIVRTKASLLFDGNLMDGFVQLLTGMADSQVRAFRHTATFCAMKITSALVDVVIELAASKEKTTKQIEAEKVKIKNNNATGNEKYEALVAQRTQTEERAEEIRQIIGYLFKSVFVHRYRDVVPDIRSICITELGNWMQVYPEHFLEDSYLKYIGWSLFDKVGDVRLKCIRALLPLFEKETFQDKIELFVNKFKQRLLTMLLDKDMETSIETCHLMRTLYIAFPTLLNLDDVIPIYELIYASNRQLAQAAAMFLNTKVFCSVTKPTKQPSVDNFPLLKDLVIFFREGDLHENATYLVDALIETNVLVKDWATMAHLLLDNQVKWETDNELTLIDIMRCSVEQTATGEPPIGRQVGKRGALSAKEIKEQSDDRQRFSEILIPAIPRLLTKFGADVQKVVHLLTIPLHFQLDMYESSRMQTSLTELLDALDDLVTKHVDDAVLKAIAELYYHLDNSPRTSALIEGHKMKLLDGIAAFIRTSVQQFEDDQMGEEEEALFLSYMKRMSAFSNYMDLSHWDMWDKLLKIVSNYDKEDTQRDVGDRAILMLFMQFCFDFIRLSKENDSPKEDQVRKLKKRRDQLIGVLKNVFVNEACNVEQSYLCICDLMIMLGAHIVDDNKALEPLIWRPDGVIIANFGMFLKTNVFDATTPDDSQQEQITMMHKRRQLVAQYAKLVIHGALPLADASLLIRYYLSHFQEFGDIFKNLLSKCREIEFVEFGLMVVETLKKVFREMPEEKRSDPESDQFQELRDLARRLTPAFGTDYAKNRFALSSLHKKAIDFAFEDYDRENETEPKNIAFLELAIEFSNKLLNQDKLAVGRYASKIYNNRVSAGPVIKWDSYRLYVNTLTGRNDDDNMSVRSGMTERSNATMRSTASSVRGRGRGRRPRIVDDF